LEVINFRQNIVATFINDETLRDSVTLLLGRTHDSQRLVQKFALGRGDPDDLLDLAKTIRATEDVATLLNGADPAVVEDECLQVLAKRISLTKPLTLAQRIKDSVDEEGLVQQHEIEESEAGEMIALAQEIVSNEGTEDDGPLLPKKVAKRKPTSLKDHYGEDNQPWIMRPEASENLTRLHASLNSLIQEKAALADNLRDRLKAPSLTLRWTPGLGHICHIKGKDTRRLSTADIRTLSSRRTTRSFHLPEWTSLGQRLDQARLQIRAEEQRVFARLREDVVHNLVRLRRNAAVLSELDVTASFAALAIEQSLVRPRLDRGTAHRVLGGRHPTVEGGLAERGRTFTRNDCLVGAPGQGRAWLVTGPNMAGKSTFLRQAALITVLAQAGAYVPAEHAEMGIVDAIYSRVGSADNLYRDQSTFMVEMLETAHILRRATPRSFVIMDEIGRGTTPEDGAAVAYAALHHLVRVNRCRTLFATHFHALAGLAAEQGMTDGEDRAVEMYCTDVEEDGTGGFVYVHKLRKGVNRQSHALKVARLAGLPEKAIEVAQRVLGETVRQADGSVAVTPEAEPRTGSESVG
jgi:DNA mismatch repair ATPase MutS